MVEDQIFRYYSQYGEDYILWKFFDYKLEGYFIDIGAFDGKHISNTYSFEEKGWKGLCVEPNPNYFNLCKSNRPGSICINAACGDRDGNITLHIDKTGLFSSFVNPVEGLSLSQHYNLLQKDPEIETVDVAMVTLGSLLDQYKKESTQIDFISIDVEGAEVLVLKGIDLVYHKPRVLVIETSMPNSSREIEEYLDDFGYFFAKQNQANSYYVCSEADKEKLQNIVNTCTLEKQVHPLGKQYTNPEYLHGKSMYKGVNVLSAIREIDGILSSYILNKNSSSLDVVAKLKLFIDERKFKMQTLNDQLESVKHERNEKVQILNAMAQEAAESNTSQVSQLMKQIEVTRSKYDDIVASMSKQINKYEKKIDELNKINSKHMLALSNMKREMGIKCKKVLSIITVVYNAKDDLLRTIESVRAQVGVEFEYIIVDGGSSDGTLDVIENNRDIIDVLISEPDSSIYEAMNKGLVLAGGFYLQFLNAGDVFSAPTSLASVYSELNNQKSHVIYGDINVYHNSKFICMNKAMDFTKDKLLKFGTGVLCHQAMFVKKDIAPLYNLKYKYKGELCWYFDICERLGDNLLFTHVEAPIVNYYLGGFGHKHFIKNRLDWIRLVKNKYGIKAILENDLLRFLYRNSLTRYPKLKKFDNFLSRITFRKGI